MFAWDPAKALANFEKHGIAFDEAATAFADPDGLDWEDREHAHAEQRFKRLARSTMGRVVVVVYTVRTKTDGKEAIRIISARQASRKERQAYSRP